jgi:hypothetical protein
MYLESFRLTSEFPYSVDLKYQMLESHLHSKPVLFHCWYFIWISLNFDCELENVLWPVTGAYSKKYSWIFELCGNVHMRRTWNFENLWRDFLLLYAAKASSPGYSVLSDGKPSDGMWPTDDHRPKNKSSALPASLIPTSLTIDNHGKMDRKIRKISRDLPGPIDRGTKVVYEKIIENRVFKCRHWIL